MTRKAKGVASPQSPRTIPPGTPVPWPPSPWGAPPLTTEERLQCIEVLVERIASHARLLPPGGGRNGVSAEARDQAVRAFYERLVQAEEELRHIQEKLRLA